MWNALLGFLARPRSVELGCGERGEVERRCVRRRITQLGDPRLNAQYNYLASIPGTEAAMERARLAGEIAALQA